MRLRDLPLKQALVAQAEAERKQRYPDQLAPVRLKSMMVLSQAPFCVCTFLTIDHCLMKLYATCQSDSGQLWESKLSCTLQGIKVMFVASGAGACHCIIGDAAGKCFTWGRNEVQTALLMFIHACYRECDCILYCKQVLLLSTSLITLQKGQLGHGDQLQRNVPTIVKGLNSKKIVAGCY